MVPEGLLPSNPVETIHDYAPNSEHSAFDRDESLETNQNIQERIERRRAIAERAQRCIEEVEASGQHPYLRPHQLEGYLNSLRLIADYDPGASDPGRGHLIAPTGSGKSAVAIAIAHDTGARTLFVTSRNVLVDQMKDESVPDFAPDMQVQELSGRTTAKRLDRADDNTDDINLTNYLYIAHGGEAHTPKPGEYDLTILDEAHAALGPKVQQKLKPIENESMAVIATTATPKTLADSVIRHYPTELAHQTMLDGIREGYLSGIQIFAAHSGRSFDDKVHGPTRDYTSKSMESLIADPERNELIYDMALHGLEHTDGTGLIVCIRGNEQQHAQDIAAGLAAKKHPLHNRNVYIEAIGDHRKDSHAAIEALKHGEIDYLTTTEMATQGVDFRTLRIGIVATSVRSPLKLEQIMGRGMRPKDDPFLLYQLFDTPRNNPESLALAWDILGIQAPKQGMAVLPPGMPEHTLAPTETLPPRLQPFLEKIPPDEQDPQSTVGSPRLAVDSDAVTAAHESGIPLTRLQEQTGIRRSILRRILFDNVYTAHMAENEDGDIEEHYPEEASILLDYLVSRPEDKTLSAAAQELSVTHAKLVHYLGQFSIHAPFLYPRDEQRWALMQRYLSPAQRSLLKERIKLPRDIASHEIGLQEMARRASSFNFRSREYLEIRGFTPEPITSLSGKRVFVYDRAAMEAYIDSYTNALPLPNKVDFTSVRNVARTHPDARDYHVFAAASILGVPVTFYKVNARHRDEFIDNTHLEKIEELLPKIIAYYDKKHAERSAQDPSYNRHHSKERVATPTERDLDPDTQEYADERITLAEFLDTLIIPIPEVQLRQTIKELSIDVGPRGLRVADAQRIYAAILKDANETPTEEPYDTESSSVQPNELVQPTLRPKSHVVLPRYVRELSREPIVEPRNLSSLQSNQYANTLLAIAKFHPQFKDKAKVARTDEAIVVDRPTYNKLFILLQQEIPRIGEHWVPAPQICQDHGIDPDSLNAWLATGGYDTKHLIPVLGSKGDRLYFCSPELARQAIDVLRSHARRLPDELSYNVEATTTTDDA